MKIVIETKLLMRVLKEITKVITGTKTTLDILQNFLFEIENNELKISATNLDYSVQSKIIVESEGSAKFTLPIRAFTNIISSLDTETVEIEPTGNSVIVKTNGSKYNLSVHPAEDFPKILTIPEDNSFILDKYTLERGVGKVEFCVASNDPRPFLNGVLVKVKNGELHLVGSDAHRLGLWIQRGLPEEINLEVIVYPGVFDFLQAREDDTVEIRFMDNFFGLYFPDAFVTSKTLEGPYADYMGIMPQEEGTVFQTETRKLLSILRRAKEFFTPPYNSIRWSLSSSSIISAQNPDIGEMEERLEGEFTGEEMEIILNGKYLTEIVRHIDSDEIRFHFYGTTAPVKIEPAGLESEEEYLYLLMPIYEE